MPRRRAERVTRRRTSSERPCEIGVISDTHGLVRPEALAALGGVDHILHAGDIGDPSVLEQLTLLAPVTAVRGNNDRGRWVSVIPPSAILEVGDVRIYVVHDVKALRLDPRKARLAAVVAGHSHRPVVEDRDGILFLNPGSAGPRRFRLPVSIGRLTVEGGRVTGRVTTLAIAA
jgi:putative phosphoesterase